MKKQNGFSSIIIISILVVLISSSGLFYVINKKKKAIEDLRNKTAEIADTQAQTDCGTDIDCFINASREGMEAKIIIENQLNLFGIIVSAKTLQELTKEELGNNYGYQSTILDASASLDEKIVSILTNPNLTKTEREKEMNKYFGLNGQGAATITDPSKPPTREELNEAIKKQTEPYIKEQIGTQTTCSYDDKTKMTAMLEKWKMGDFSTEDLNFAKCEIKDKNGIVTPLNTGPQTITPPATEKTTTKNPAGGTITTTITTKETPPPETRKTSCFFSEDCQAGYHCFEKECISNTILSKFSKCEPEVCQESPTGTSCSFNVCNQTCTNCKKGKLTCLLSSEEIKDGLCVECSSNFFSQCNEGYTCKEYRCVR